MAGAGAGSPPSSAFSSRCLGSGCGSGCRRSARDPCCRVCAYSRSRRSSRWCACATGRRGRFDAGSIAAADLRTPAGDGDCRRARGHAARSVFAGACGKAHLERTLRRCARVQGRLAVAAPVGARSLRAARVSCSSPSSPPLSPPAANIGSASRRRSTGRAWYCRRISASTPGSLRPLTPASRRSFSPDIHPGEWRRQAGCASGTGDCGAGRKHARRARHRQGRSRSRRQRRRHAGEGRRARAGRHAGVPLQNHRHRAPRRYAARATIWSGRSTPFPTSRRPSR